MHIGGTQGGSKTIRVVTTTHNEHKTTMNCKKKTMNKTTRVVVMVLNTTTMTMSKTKGAIIMALKTTTTKKLP